MGEIRGGVGLMAAIELNAELQHTPGAVRGLYLAIRDAGVLLRAQRTGVAIGPPLIVEREHLREIGEAVARRAGRRRLALKGLPHHRAVATRLLGGVERGVGPLEEAFAGLQAVPAGDAGRAGLALGRRGRRSRSQSRSAAARSQSGRARTNSSPP